jgi:SSS family solute:Na+ symporter
MDVYAKKINPHASDREIIRIGRLTVVVGCIFAVLVALAIDNIKGLNLFDIFQSVLGFIAPPLAVVFLLTVFWKRTTKRAVNLILSAGSAFSLGTGIMYLWVFTSDKYSFWPHYLLLSFYIFAILILSAILISWTDPNGKVFENSAIHGELVKPTRRVWVLWGALAVVMVILYLVFNGH